MSWLLLALLAAPVAEEGTPAGEDAPSEETAADQGAQAAPPLLGELDFARRQAVLLVFRERGEELGPCYETSLKSKRELRGRVELDLDIQAGEVRSATVHLNDTGDATLGDCLARVVSGWRFSPQLNAHFRYLLRFDAPPDARARAAKAAAPQPSEGY